MQALREKLRSIEAFAGLSQEALERVADAATTRRVKRGEWVLMEGDEEAPVFGIIEGHVRTLLVNPAGRQQVLIHLQPGDLFNLPAAFDSQHRAPAGVVAVDDTLLVAFELRAFRSCVLANSELSAAVLADLSGKLRHLAGLVQDLSLRSVRTRCARFILGLESQKARRKWTHEEIATHVGTVREVVSRTLRAMANDGLIDIQRQRITVVDRKALAEEGEA